MSESDFWAGELRDALIRISGYREVEQAEYRAGWEQSRLVCDVIVACSMSKSKSAGIKFSWDAQAPKPRQLSPEQIERQKAKRAKLDKLALEWQAARGI
jgi:hypothetical protein